MTTLRGWLVCMLVSILVRNTVLGQTGRFAAPGDGTVTDNLTGLTWLRQASALGQLGWDEALQRCVQLGDGVMEGLSDGSRPGDWRLPTLHELLTLTDQGVYGASLPEKHLFKALPGRSVRLTAPFWTSTVGHYDPRRAWFVQPGQGRHARSSFSEKTEQHYVWPVRGTMRNSPGRGPQPDLAATWDQLTPREQVRAERNALWDFQGLRGQRDFVSIATNEFLRVPPGLKTWVPSDRYAVAREAPSVRLRILPNLEPEYFPEGEAYSAGWANWAKITRGPNNRFFMASSDHRGRGAGINLYEYNAPEDALKRVLDVRKALGWTADQYTDGKIHGYMGLMPDGTLWAATHRGPKPTDAWYEEGYRGSWLFSYNIHTGESKNWGVPLVGNSLPYYSIDVPRGIFFGTGENNTLLCWDLHKRRTRFAGYPPNGWNWYQVSVQLHDVKTGIFWGMDASETPYRFLSYDPERNRFERHNLEIPVNPVTGEQGMLRHNTQRPDADGWYYCFAGGKGGTLFRFRPDGPDGPEAEPLAVTSGANGASVHQIELGPAGRYVYYVPRRRDAMVIMQYDIQTGIHKALGFLSEPFFRDYGYWMGNGTYGMNVSEDGSFLVILENGAFAGRGSGFGGHPALLVVSIPEAERRVD